ncbi:MAG: hypothetical protein R2772_07775 [Chitinophagales bacterium]
MAKVLGVMLTILGTLGCLGNLFLYLNSSAYLRYNPADSVKGLLDVGLAFQIVLFGLLLLGGVLLVKYSTEPESK